MENDRSVSLEDQDVPPDLAARLGAAFGLDESPATLEDVVTLLTAFLDDSDCSVGIDNLCTASTSRHEARIDGDRRYFHCVLDTVLLPFVRPGETPVEVRSASPQSEEVVELTVSRDDLEVRPHAAVMSFGLADELSVPDAAVVDPTTAYTSLCPYINAFPSRAMYEKWDGKTPEATTMAVSFPTGLELARQLAGQSTPVDEQ